MPREKYPDYVAPHLEQITAWVREGANEYYICQRLGVSTQSWCEYKKKYPELLEAVKKGQCKIVKDLKNALLKRALGFEYEEKKRYQKRDNPNDENATTYVEITTKYALPDVAAINLALKNFDRIREDNPNGWLNDPAYYDLRKAELELRERLANEKQWTSMTPKEDDEVKRVRVAVKGDSKEIESEGFIV